MAVDVGGFVRFNITVGLSPEEIKDWSPERIKAWFDGVAQVVCAAGESAIVEIEAWFDGVAQVVCAAGESAIVEIEQLPERERERVPNAKR